MRTTGPSSDIEIATGDGWVLTARIEDGEVVRELRTERGSAFGKSTLGVTDATGSLIDWSGLVDDTFYLFGIASPVVVQVRVEFKDGGAVNTSMIGDKGSRLRSTQ